jgi:ADP-heptose:LPS heptosyltransferase
VDRGKQVERYVKRGIFGLLAGGATREADVTKVDLRGVRRILLVRANVRLGNLLIITPAIAAIRQALPRARIDVLCDAAYGCILSSDPFVDHVVGINRRVMRDPLALAALVRGLRRRRYDLVVECARGGSFLGAILTRLTAGRMRIASVDGRYRRFFNVYVPRSRRTHKVDLLLDLLAGIGIPAQSPELRMVLTDAERTTAANRWTSWGVPADREIVAIHLGGRGTKRWPVERFAELARRMPPDVSVALFAGPEDRDLLAQIEADLPRSVIVPPELPVREFAALLAGCTLVVTADTGPMHLAGAVGTPTVTITQTTKSADYAPQGPRHRTVHEVGGPSVQRVLAAVDEALGDERRAGDRGRTGDVQPGNFP